MNFMEVAGKLLSAVIEGTRRLTRREFLGAAGATDRAAQPRVFMHGIFGRAPFQHEQSWPQELPSQPWLYFGASFISTSFSMK